jgi:hypothetical protein
VATWQAKTGSHSTVDGLFVVRFLMEEGWIWSNKQHSHAHARG